MKVYFDLKTLHVNSMDNAMINVGKNFIVTPKGHGKEDKGGEQTRVERMGSDSLTGSTPPRPAVRE